MAQFRVVLGVDGGVVVVLNATMRERVAEVFETLSGSTTTDRAFAKALRNPVTTDPPDNPTTSMTVSVPPEAP